LVLDSNTGTFLKKLGENAELSTSELALIWIMIAASSAVPGYGMMEFIFPYL